jgi:hypothetical protein
MKGAHARLLLALALAGCSFNDGSNGQPGADALPLTCHPDLGYLPMDPIAGASTTIHVTSKLDSIPGVLLYHWQVLFNGTSVAFGIFGGDQTQIDFLATAPGVYDVSVAVTGAPVPCSNQVVVNVGAPNARHEPLRLRIVPPRSVAAPIFEKTIMIGGGASVHLGTTQIDPGAPVAPTVRIGTRGVPAYVRFTPIAAPDAIVETFSDPRGAVATRLIAGSYTVLVIPSSDDAPARIANWSYTSATLTLVAGTPITGTVHDANNDPVVGATVQVTIDGVPSTLATTGTDGSFALRGQPGTGTITVEVSPPAASGLPRLTASSSMFDMKKSLQIRYTALTRRNLAGVRVMRDGAPVAGAQVTVLGKLPAGVVDAGATVNAIGDVRITATAGADGALPSMAVPSAVLSAVIAAPSGDLAVATLNTTSAAPATVDAPPPQPLATVATDGGTPLPGAVLDVVPTGALAMTGAAPLHLVAGSAGALTASLAAGGHYDLRFRDPQRRRAPRVVTDINAAAIEPSYVLPLALEIRGTVMSGTQSLANAAIQILCEDCVGLERTRPIAEAVSDGAGFFKLAVPDPGTM